MVDRWLKWENGKEWGRIRCPLLNDEYVMTYYPKSALCYYLYTAPFVRSGNVCYYRYNHNEGFWDDRLYCVGEYIEDIPQRIFIE
ncbi:MAG: hypothetical protein K2O91_12090 [Lachnospiraceae bacterium]|nr:hypothetical protein [Lachnospiraceae bacterium]